ncbi:MAG TPA: glycosyltransferase family 4 protein [Petrimonas sp.]|nr:glycosyltransferase family 4 protein [Petrimonas sp.]
MKRKKVLLVYPNYSSFVKTDFEILSSEFEVTRYHFQPVKGALRTLRELMKQFVFLLFNLRKFNFVFIWFADTHAFGPVLFGNLLKIKSAVVIGGFDAVSLPEIKYGLYCSNQIRQFLGKYAVKHASYLLPVDESLIENTNYFADPAGKGLPVGVKKFVPGIKGKIIVVPTGYDTDFWQPTKGVVRKKSVVTVAAITNWQRWYLKGCDFLSQIASKMPETEFYIYGISNAMFEELQKIALPDNLYLNGLVSTEKLPAIYSAHQIYAQLSLSEGLPNVLCEAILCGCIPIGSNVNGIPRIIENKGLIIKNQKKTEAINAILYAQKISDIEIEKNRTLIISQFDKNKRIKALKLLLTEV